MAFGDFTSICNQAPIPLCTVIGPGGLGIESSCYARNIELANTIIFQAAASVVHIATLIMTVVMILHVRSKFTAVGTLAPSASLFLETNHCEQVAKK